MVLFITTVVYASWVDIPIEDLIKNSDLIIVGKISGIDTSKKQNPDSEIIKIMGRYYDFGTITVSQVIKGDEHAKSVVLRYPSRRELSTDIVYELNQNGIWLLTKSKEGDFYLAGYPKDFQDISQLNTIKTLVQNRER
jgi:hypothetical protein